MEGRSCSTEGCSNPASLQCPTCVKLGIAGSFFCSQDCFKSSWGVHKNVHKTSAATAGASSSSAAAAGSAQAEDDSAHLKLFETFTFTGSLRPARYGPRRTVPDSIPKPDYATHPKGVSRAEESTKGSMSIELLRNPNDLQSLRESCLLGRRVLDLAGQMVRPGVTTDEIDRVVHEFLVEHGAYPSPLNYYEFPKSVCTSVNEVICHGIPDMRELQEGDICNIDVSCYFKGFHADLNETFFVGAVDEGSRHLVKTAYECLMKAIEICKPGTMYRDLGNIISKHAQNNGLSVVRSFCGHGIGRLFHSAPNVPHYGKNKAVGVMKPGHVFTIEPMINAGAWRDKLWPDEWTAVTLDGKRSAQFEHTLLITETGCEILTARLPESGPLPWE